MRLLVSGSRTWDDEEAVREVLRDAWKRIGAATLVHGGARGLDRMAAGIWSGAGLPVEEWPADWERFGRSAGFRRNEAMVEAGADLCAVFVRSGSRGASHTARIAQAAGIPTRVIRQG